MRVCMLLISDGQVSKLESATKVIKMTTPRHDTFEIALNPDLQSYSFSELLRDLNGCSNGGHWKIIYASASYLTRTIPGQLLITLQSFIHTIFLFLENFDKKCLFENNYCQFYNELCRCDLIVFLKRSTFHFTPPPLPPPPPHAPEEDLRNILKICSEVSSKFCILPQC